MSIAAEEICQKSAVFAAARIWAEDHKEEIPPAVYNSIILIASLRSELLKTKSRAAHLLALFRRELGITPKSESGSSSIQPEKAAKDKLTPEEQIAKLKARRVKLLKEIRRYEDRLGKDRKRGQKEKAKERAKAASSFVSSDETIFAGNMSDKVSLDLPQQVDRVENFTNPRGLHGSSDDRTRHEHCFTTTTYNISVETVTDPRTGKSVTASTDHIGPPNCQSTWVGIANTIIAVIGYAIPINRLATMLQESNSYFSSARLCSQLKLSAEIFEPIYSFLGTALADCSVLAGDDTKVRVNEINRALKNGGELDPPIEDSLIEKLANVFGRVFAKKNGKGKKRSLNVSVVIGKTVVSDPRSYIFFFRSHLGSLGDLLTKILENRKPKFKQLTIVTDLATTNLVSKELYTLFDIKQGGCAAHARRPFWKHKDKDQKLCYWMLSAFLVLEQIEDRIDELGRTEANINRYRQRYSKKVWAIILKRSEAVVRGEKSYSDYWPKNSYIYDACNYIITHFKIITAHIYDARLPSNNNLSERVLRWEKVMEDSSKFRMTEVGRLQVDILRTIVHTCSAAKVELKDYLLFAFKNREKIKEDASDYTPYAYALSLEKIDNKSSDNAQVQPRT